jgi:replication factor A1
MRLLRSPLGLSGKSSNSAKRLRACARGFRPIQQELILYRAIFDETKPQVREPIVQCVQVKPLPGQPGHPERYRAVFSDIANYVQTMLATRKSILRRNSGFLLTCCVSAEANHVVTDGSLRKGCFVRLKSFQANSVKVKK